MSVYTSVSRCSSEILTILIRNMLSCPGLSVSLGEPKVNDVHIMLFLANADEEVVRLDVSVQEVSGVHVLDSLDHLVSQHEDGLQRELPFAVIEQVLQRGPQKVDYHHVVVPFYSKPMHIGDAYSSLQNTVEFGLIEQLRVFGSNRFLSVRKDLQALSLLLHSS